MRQIFMLFLSRFFDDVDNPVNSGLKTGNKLSFIFLPNQFLLNFLLACLNFSHKFLLIYTSSVFCDFFNKLCRTNAHVFFFLFRVLRFFYPPVSYSVFLWIKLCFNHGITINNLKNFNLVNNQKKIYPYLSIK